MAKISRVIVAVAAVLTASSAHASYFTCSATVNAQPSAVLEQFPATVAYDLTLTEAYCDWCATQAPEHFCHAICASNDAWSMVTSESDAVVASLIGQAIPWATTGGPLDPQFPFWMHQGQSLTTSVSATLASYADCATRARNLPVPVLPDASGRVDIVDVYQVTWATNGVPPYEVSCSAKISCVPPLGPTRTLGYFKTHPAALQACVAGGAMQVGALTIGSADAALGLLWASPAKYADGTKRSAYDQAVVLLQRQLLTAICNGRVFGSSPADDLVAWAQAALAGTSCGTMSWITGQLDAFNNSGDTGEVWFGAAQPGAYPDPTSKTSGVCR